jgi:hypothetical protein
MVFWLDIRALDLSRFSGVLSESIGLRFMNALNHLSDGPCSALAVSRPKN